MAGLPSRHYPNGGKILGPHSCQPISKQTDKNYRKARQIAYNIGGVNFLQYLPERNSVPDKTLKMMDGIGQMDIFAANKKNICSALTSPSIN